MENPKSQSPFWKGLFIIVLLLICLYLSIHMYWLSSKVHILSNRVILLRVLAPLRTRAEVLEWMGPPDSIKRNIVIGERQVDELMIYKSHPRRINGTEDIWVATNKQGKIEVVYYPDNSQEKRILDSVK